MAAPRLVAKGNGALAERVRARLPRAGRVNPPLARAVHGAEVPPAHYRAVAGVIGDVLRRQRY